MTEMRTVRLHDTEATILLNLITKEISFLMLKEGALPSKEAGENRRAIQELRRLSTKFSR